MILNGDIPIGLMEDLYSRLVDNGIDIEDFRVDTVKGEIEISTNVLITDSIINDIFLSEGLWEDAKYYVNDLVGDNHLDNALNYFKNERGSFTLGTALIGAGFVAGNGAIIASTTSDIPSLSPGLNACVVVACVIAVICIAKSILKEYLN